MTKFNGVTIDDASSWDLDDSVWAEETEEGVLLTVCIADVAGAIPRGHDFDAAARAKVETRYWAGGNTPMIPRVLADGEVSLLPGKTRQVVAIQMLLDGHYALVGEPKVTLGTLNSRAKIAYDAVPGLLMGSAPHTPVLRMLQKVALGLLDKRRLAGALAFYDLNEGWTTTEEGTILKLERAQANVGYILIQEAMILANTCFARYAGTHSIPVLFRNHTAKTVAPAREELLRQLEAVRLDPSQIGALRQRVHMVMNRATYDPVILGHYGLSLPFYLHGSSPIRRYADLVTQRQIRAHVLGEPLPYTLEEVGLEAQHIMTWLKEADDKKSVQMKEQAEQRADRQADRLGPAQLVALKPKEFERVLKMTTRSDEHHAEVAEAIRLKLAEGTLAVLDMFIVLMARPVWLAERQAVIDHLQAHTHFAMSLFSVGVSVAGWPVPEFTEQREGQAHALRFRVTATTSSGGTAMTSKEVVAPALKVAKSMAVVDLLARLSGVASPKWPKQGKPPEAAKPVVDLKAPPAEGGNAVAALQEHAQAGKLAFPEYTFERAGGPDHMPLFACTCTYQGRNLTSLPDGNKKAAKKEAAGLVLAALKLRA